MQFAVSTLSLKDNLASLDPLSRLLVAEHARQYKNYNEQTPIEFIISILGVRPNSDLMREMANPFFWAMYEEGGVFVSLGGFYPRPAEVIEKALELLRNAVKAAA